MDNVQELNNYVNVPPSHSFDYTHAECCLFLTYIRTPTERTKLHSSEWRGELGMMKGQEYERKSLKLLNH
jgi:hypothetical protein